MATLLTPKGYPKLANLMARHGETAIFRRFSPLNMLNLMSLQAELIDLEVQFKDTCREDDESDDLEEKVFTSDFWTLRRSQNSNSEQWRLILEIRAKLREYNSVLLQVSQIANLGSPEAADIAFLHDWLAGDDALEGNGFLKGREIQTWSQVNQWDLAPVAKRKEEEDPISKWLSECLLKIYHTKIGVLKEKGKNLESGAYFYNTPPIGSIITTILSSTIPILTILVLYFVKNTLKRIGIMIAFTMVFAGVLSTFTSAKRIEIFAATAALAAVEVVFIGSPNTA